MTCGRSFAAILVIVLGVAAALLLAGDWLREYEPDCDGYSFDESAWADDAGDSREHQAEALVECNVLIGLRRDDVTAMLGAGTGSGEGRTLRFSAGWVNDGIGPGDGQTLYVFLSSNDRVQAARLAYPQ